MPGDIPCLAVDRTGVAGIMYYIGDGSGCPPIGTAFGREAAGEFGNRVMVHGFQGNAGSLLMERLSHGESLRNGDMSWPPPLIMVCWSTEGCEVRVPSGDPEVCHSG